MNRRRFLRAGALLGMGAGNLLTTKAAEAGWAMSGGVPAPELLNAFGAPTSHEGALHHPRGSELAELNLVNESPGLAPSRQVIYPAPLEASAQGVALQLHFRNSYGPRIRLCISFHSPATCAGRGDWGTRGWWSFDLNQSVYVLNTGYRLAYYFAEAADGAFWTGSDFSIFAPAASFDSCSWNQRIGDRSLGMRTVNLKDDVQTINLTR
ncbi:MULTISPECIES: DUF1036 domain-containing protein [Myxococcus]|uniref:DUF1036 domain-containing protein n=1 Tax=Myxococcus TaxID=32 RepID=UPI0013D2EF37|nr:MULTISPECIES: DUF1036 domain-containing protein [Myxococcus]NVJ19863.1 hypothetical protein [Myxococcus sp. AM011]